MDKLPRSPIHLKVLAGVGLVFGVLTVVSGGLPSLGQRRRRTPSEISFPSCCGSTSWPATPYVAAGLGLFLRQDWAVGLSLALFVATFLILVGFALHVATGGLYEMRTVGALLLRTTVWAAIAFYARRASWYRHRGNVL